MEIGESQIRQVIADIITDFADINVEYGEDIYVTNSEYLADLILEVVWGKEYNTKPVDPDKMDAIGRKIGEIKQ